jgi:hypothetical protein
MNYVLKAALVVVGIIHLLPIIGVLGPERLQALYGVELTDPNLVLLMRHRAVLFGLLGAFILIAAFVPSLQLSALILGAASASAFLVLAATGGPFNPGIARIVAADWIAVAAAVVGSIAYALQRPPA